MQTEKILLEKILPAEDSPSVGAETQAARTVEKKFVAGKIAEETLFVERIFQSADCCQIETAEPCLRIRFVEADIRFAVTGIRLAAVDSLFVEVENQ